MIWNPWTAAWISAVGFWMFFPEVLLLLQSNVAAAAAEEGGGVAAVTLDAPVFATSLI